MADHFRASDMKYGMLELNIPAAVQGERESTATTPLLSMCREIMQTLDIVPRKSQMPQGTSFPGNS